MSQFKREQFTNEQLAVIDNTDRLNQLFETFSSIACREDLNLTRKRADMFKLLILYMSSRKQELINVGIKSNIADKIIKNEIKTLNLVVKELKNAIQ